MTTDNDNKKYNTNYYNLDDAVISIGFRVNSEKAIQFRKWSINVLKEFAKKGYIIDKKRKDSGFSHIAIEAPGENTSNEWCETVTDEEYEKLK